MLTLNYCIFFKQILGISYAYMVIFSPKFVLYLTFYPVSVIITLYLLKLIIIMVIKTIIWTQEVLISFELITTQLFNLLLVSQEIFKVFVPLLYFLLTSLRHIIIFDKDLKLNKKSMQYLIYLIWIYVFFYFC